MQLMMRRILPLFFLSCVFSWPLLAQLDCASAPAAAETRAFGEKLQLRGIPNAGRISDSLYRGAQPRERGFSELKKLGITTIVDLRGENRDKAEGERRNAESLGMRFVYIPVGGWAAPSDEQVAQFLFLFRDDPQQKIFVHCRFGDDRTGVFVAAYRMALERWPEERAVKEMYYFGFNGFWHPAMKSFIRDFPARLNSAPALSSLHPVDAQR
jgi:tyrosine-protein phosphatase SIW14